MFKLGDKLKLTKDSERYTSNRMQLAVEIIFIRFVKAHYEAATERLCLVKFDNFKHPVVVATELFIKDE